MNLDSKIRVIENFPVEGISFKDITTLIADGEAYHYSIEEMIKVFNDLQYNIIVAPEARGFLFGAPMAVLTKKSFVPIRKKGKLPFETLAYEYELEYGTDILEVHQDAIKPGDKVLIIDDLLATGGTVSAIVEMVKKLGGEVVGIGFLIELTFLNGRELLNDYRIETLIQY
ncbi:MAG: adenine phosphoribosyltransferase [Clostridiales bacterium]|nr:adenine phosphoribosyltransferase [Clostridiales bacterium]